MPDTTVPRICPDCKCEMRLICSRYSTVYTCDECNIKLTIPPVLPNIRPRA